MTLAETVHASTTAPHTRTLKNGAPVHVFTPEDRLKGAQRSAEVRRERAKSHGQRVRERIEKQEKALVDALVSKAKEGNVQALQTLWAYAYGTPAKVEPDQMDLNVSSDDGPRGTSLGELNALASKLGIEANGKSGASNPG
jgi:hypothetical protein